MVQGDLFAPRESRSTPPPADRIVDAAAMQRLHALCSWCVESSPGGWSMRQGWRASAPWQNMDDAEKASRGASKKLERRKSWASMTTEQRLAALADLEPFVLYTLRLGRATRTIMSAHEPAKMTMREVEESTQEIAAMCESPAGVVLRYVLTGDVTP